MERLNHQSSATMATTSTTIIAAPTARSQLAETTSSMLARTAITAEPTLLTDPAYRIAPTRAAVMVLSKQTKIVKTATPQTTTAALLLACLRPAAMASPKATRSATMAITSPMMAALQTVRAKTLSRYK